MSERHSRRRFAESHTFSGEFEGSELFRTLFVRIEPAADPADRRERQPENLGIVGKLVGNRSVETRRVERVSQLGISSGE